MTSTPEIAAHGRPAARITRASVLALLLGSVVVACSGGSSASGSPTARPTPSPGESASVEPFRTPTPTPKPTVGGADAEALLKELLPGGGTGATCAAATDTEDRVAEARIRCIYRSLGQTVWLSQYPDGDELEAAYLEQQTGAKTAGKGCEAARFHGTYSLDGMRQGEVACLKKSADAWLVWTVEDRFVLGEATRKGNKSKPLYQWWAKAKPVGAKGALKLTTTTPPPAESPELPDESAEPSES